VLMVVGLGQAMIITLAMFLASGSGGSLRSILFAIGFFVVGCAFIPLGGLVFETQKPVLWVFENSPLLTKLAVFWGRGQHAFFIIAGVECLLIVLLQYLAFTNFRVIALSRRKLVVQWISIVFLIGILVVGFTALSLLSIKLRDYPASQNKA
jgi:hypothetical protein